MIDGTVVPVSEGSTDDLDVVDTTTRYVEEDDAGELDVGVTVDLVASLTSLKAVVPSE